MVAVIQHVSLQLARAHCLSRLFSVLMRCTLCAIMLLVSATTSSSTCRCAAMARTCSFRAGASSDSAVRPASCSRLRPDADAAEGEEAEGREEGEGEEEGGEAAAPPWGCWCANSRALMSDGLTAEGRTCWAVNSDASAMG